MLVIKAGCPDHGEVTLTADDVLVAPTMFLAHCTEGDHLFGQEIRSERVRQTLVAAGVEQLCP